MERHAHIAPAGVPIDYHDAAAPLPITDADVDTFRAQDVYTSR